MTDQPIDQAKLDAFLGQMLGDLGGAMSVALVRMGDTLGLYKTLDQHGPATPAELAVRTGLAERYLREWLSAQAASNYLAYDGGSGKFSLPPEQAMVFAREDSPACPSSKYLRQASLLANGGSGSSLV